MSSQGPRDTLIPEAPQVPVAERDGTSIYRRRIRLLAGDDWASGELEDDFHHFAAHVEHDRRVVRAVRGEAIRYPWTTCPGAVEPLGALCGRALTRDLHRMSSDLDPRMQCTHLLDVATLAVASAAAGRERCIYDAAVPEAREGCMTVSLDRDGEPLLRWDLESFRVTSRGPLEGRFLIGADFRKAVQALRDADLVEASLVLRRAVMISMARRFDMDRVTDPSAFGRAVGAKCHTFSDANEAHARRIVGADRDFTARPDALLARDPH